MNIKEKIQQEAEKKKEEILDKTHWDYVTEKGISSVHMKTIPEAYRPQVLIAMDKYAEWLLSQIGKENEGLQTGIDAAQEMITDKNEQIYFFKSQLSSSEAEIERLKGLIKRQFLLRRLGAGIRETTSEGAWQQFKIGNNL